MAICGSGRYTAAGYGAGYGYARRGKAGVVYCVHRDEIDWHPTNSVGATRVMAVYRRQDAPGYIAFVRFD